MKPQPVMQKISVSLQDIWDAMRGNVERNKKKYYRKKKHKKKYGSG